MFVFIHRTSLGCYERTLAWLIEHYSGIDSITITAAV